MTAKQLEALAAGLVEIMSKALADPTHRLVRLELHNTDVAAKIRELEARVVELEADRAAAAVGDD